VCLQRDFKFFFFWSRELSFLLPVILRSFCQKKESNIKIMTLLGFKYGITIYNLVKKNNYWTAMVYIFAMESQY